MVMVDIGTPAMEAKREAAENRANTCEWKGRAGDSGAAKKVAALGKLHTQCHGACYLANPRFV